LISELDNWRAANLAIRQHSAAAIAEATQLDRRMPDRGRGDGTPHIADGASL
jgi:hypothetical protein